MASIQEYSGAGNYIAMALTVDGTEVDYMETYGSNQRLQSVSVQAVVQLSAGQSVWLKHAGGDGTYWSNPTSFSGVLLHHSV